MFNHIDSLKGLDLNLLLNEKLAIIHEAVQQRYPFIQRISVAAYDAKTELIKTFLVSAQQSEALVYYEAQLNRTSSLKDLIKTGRPRVINDLSLFDQNRQEHTAKIRSHGYQASYTLPLFNNSNLTGLLFYNSREKNCFNEPILADLDLYGHLIALIINKELTAIETLCSTMRISSNMVHLRDPETGQHLDRMSRYARLIAQGLATAGRYRFNDEFIEQIFLFSPLHDIGKIGIPDNILHKPARLEPEEFEIMKTHTIKGLKIIDDIIKQFGFESFSGLAVLRNIVGSHHEAIDGTGYPNRLTDQQIPIEARIVSVADIFDALTNRRSYKPAWSNDRAFAQLKQLSITKLDQDCVDVLINSRRKIAELQKQFQEFYIPTPESSSITESPSSLSIATLNQ